MSYEKTKKYLPNQINLKAVKVRPIRTSERSEWDRLMSTHHYLGFKTLVGESIRYVAEDDSRWVALLGWSASALQCKARDSWIGWSQAIQWQRLHLIVNNSRFLILPQIKCYNLASKILSLNLKRIALDWENIYNHTVLLAETFVDTTRFTGASYKAANWKLLGYSKGFGKSADKYYYHGQPKAIFVKKLHKRAVQILTNPMINSKFIKKVTPMNFKKKQIQDLIKILKSLPDPRKKRGKRHRVLSIMALAICAVLCGARSFIAITDWGKKRTQNQLKRLWTRYDEKKNCYTPPSEPTIRRVLQSIDAEAVDQAIYGWLHSICGGKAIAFDGKVVRGAKDENGKQVNLLSAIIHHEGITIAQKQVESKTNEIPMAKPLLEPLDLKEKVVTADALHTQKDISCFLVEEKKADYFWIVKDNQPTLRENIEALALNKGFPPRS